MNLLGGVMPYVHMTMRRSHGGAPCTTRRVEITWFRRTLGIDYCAATWRRNLLDGDWGAK